jgi:phenylacetate-CoA ligase
LECVLRGNEFYRKKIAGFHLDREKDLRESPEHVLERLPFTTKADLESDQEQHPPFGTNLSFALESYSRIHQTSGSTGRPLWWLDTRESWQWCSRLWEEVYRAAGVTGADRIFFPFSFGPFLGFWAAFEAGIRLGSLSIPGGGMGTLARLRVLMETGATVVAATPTYALRMAEVARAEGIDLAGSAVRVIIVAGEPGGSVLSVKERMESAWGARSFDHSGMTESGPFGFECVESPGGLHVIEDEFIVEVIHPETGKRLPEGEEGELVLTNLGRPGSPLLRYRTGDLARWSLKACPCGRITGRLEGGILGRLDDMVYVGGNNLYPSAVEGVLRQFPEVAEYRVRLVQSREMTKLRVEIEPVPGLARGGAEALSARLASLLEKTFLFRAEVASLEPGSLPRFEMKGKRFFKE